MGKKKENILFLNSPLLKHLVGVIRFQDKFLRRFRKIIFVGECWILCFSVWHIFQMKNADNVLQLAPKIFLVFSGIC